MSTNGNDGGASRSPDERMNLLERRARVIRSRLLRAVDALDTRRHQVEEVGAQAKEVAVPAAIGLAAVVALLGASAFSFGLARKARRRRSVRYRVMEALRGLDLARPPSLGRRMAEKAALALVSLAATEVAKRAAHNVLDGRLLDGRLAVGAALDHHHETIAKPSAGVYTS